MCDSCVIPDDPWRRLARHADSLNVRCVRWILTNLVFRSIFNVMNAIDSCIGGKWKGWVNFFLKCDRVAGAGAGEFSVIIAHPIGRTNCNLTNGDNVWCSQLKMNNKNKTTTAKQTASFSSLLKIIVKHCKMHGLQLCYYRVSINITLHIQ